MDDDKKQDKLGQRVVSLTLLFAFCALIGAGTVDAIVEIVRAVGL